MVVNYEDGSAVSQELYSGEQTATRQPRIIGGEDRINFGGEQVSKVQLLEAFQETGGG